MKQKTITKAVTARLAILALLVSGSLFGVTAAKAADVPTIRVTSPTFSAQNETFANDGLGQYYAAGGRIRCLLARRKVLPYHKAHKYPEIYRRRHIPGVCGM